ncbi:type I-F CRISPR-associated protein Cas7f/Csy3 [Providencia sp. PROV170]
MAKNNDVASVLAFEKKLVPSDGYFYGTCWENKSHFTLYHYKKNRYGVLFPIA